MKDMINRWFGRALRGDRLIYHTGLLMADRGYEDHKNGRTAQEEIIDEGARRAWQLYEQGRVVLTQRRFTNRSCEYIMVRR